MKIRVTMKTPDALEQAVKDAVELETGPPGGMMTRQEEAAELVREITQQWMRYGEYLTVECDTSAMTATVVPRGR